MCAMSAQCVAKPAFFFQGAEKKMNVLSIELRCAVPVDVGPVLSLARGVWHAWGRRKHDFATQLPGIICSKLVIRLSQATELMIRTPHPGERRPRRALNSKPSLTNEPEQSHDLFGFYLLVD